MKKQFKKVTAAVLVLLLLMSNFYAFAEFNSYECEFNTKLDDDLSGIMDNMSSRELISIIVWLNDAGSSATSDNIRPDETLTADVMMKFTNRELDNKEALEVVHKIREYKTAVSHEKYKSFNTKTAEKISLYGEVKYVSEYSPVIFVRATVENINEIAKLKEVYHIYYDKPVKFEPMLNISRQVVRANTVQNLSMLGYTGAGVKIGMIDGAIPELSNRALSTVNITVDPNCQNTMYETDLVVHATTVASIMVGSGTRTSRKGIAPEAELYCTTVSMGSDIVADDYIQNLNWLINQAPDVINMSCGSYYEANEYSITDLFIDFYSSHYLITFVVSAGNASVCGVSNMGMAYNAITVGNIDDRNTVSTEDDQLNFYSDATDMYKSGSSYKNFLNITTASKPDLCAPGTDIQTDSLVVGKTGTSCSAPHVTGAVALLGDQDPWLLISPVAMKAVIVTGVKSDNFCYVPSQRQASSSFANPASSYIQFGAGILDCLRNAYISRALQYDFTYMGENDQRVVFSFNCNSGSRVRVSLVFEKTVEEESENVVRFYNDNLDLKIYSPSNELVGSSTTSYNNIEIVDFVPSTTGAYQIHINRVATNNPSDVRFAYAWIQD